MPVISRVSSGVLAVLLTIAPTVSAQPDALAAGVRVDGGGQPYRAWDFTVSTGLHADADVRTWVPGQSNGSYWDGGWGLQFDVGRYWSSHLKTEFAGAVLTTRDAYGYENIVVSGRQAQTSWSARGRRGYASSAVTWQFLDNTFAHPFVSGGVRLNVTGLSRERQPWAWSWNGTSGTMLTLDPLHEDVTKWQARPFVAAGYKSYFYNERTFMRSEIAFDFAQRGLLRWSLRTGFGVDF